MKKLAILSIGIKNSLPNPPYYFPRSHNSLFSIRQKSILKTKFGKKQPPPSLWNIIYKGRY